MRQPSWKQLRVLYVEDEALIAIDGEQTLQALGFEDITLAMSFEQARALVESRSFDLALLDINLGGGRTSMSLADALLAAGCRVLYLSGYSASRDLKERLRGPLVGKPFDEDSLRGAIAGVLGANDGEAGGPAANAGRATHAAAG